MKVNFYNYKIMKPLVLLESSTNTTHEEFLYEKYYNKFYEVLLLKDLIFPDSILIFCNIKDKVKKQIQHQGSINSDKELLKTLDNIDNMNNFINYSLKEFSPNYILELTNDKIKIKKIEYSKNI